MAKSDAYYESVRSQLEAAVQRGKEPENVFWEVIEGLTAIIDGATDSNIAGSIGAGGQTVYNLITQKDGSAIATTPNPWFVFNGHEGDTRYTKKYLRNRSLKGLGGSALGFAGVAASQATQVDIAGIAMHSNATGSTLAHLYQLQSIAKGYKQSRTISDWIGLVAKMKGIKAGVRGGQLAGAAIPVGAVGIATGVAAAAVKIGVKLTLTKACLTTASDIHWRAFQEQKIAGAFGGAGKIGPASKIMYELFARRGATRIFGKYDVDRLIKEPSGWMAVSDKLLLI